MKKRILVIEDNVDIAHLLKVNLQDIDCDVQISNNGKEGLDYALNEKFDLVILDIMLPQLDGIEVCRKIRHKNSYLPILMLTAKTSELDRVLGLEIGADDYMTKPFSIRELMARVKAIFRRANLVDKSGNQESESQLIQCDGMEINIEKRNVNINGEQVELTAREFDLLVHFASHPGRVYSRSQLLDLVWGYGHDGYEHTVNSHINRLRAKIESDPAKPEYVLTVWGVGYKFHEYHV
ncbi:MAG: response regulator transcription factor [Gammaproteobacteria bacterium]|nr:response regulator transcription factor [Gammaproteobacteria bacterium]